MKRESKARDSGFGVVMCSDKKFAPLLRVAVASIRRFNSCLPIRIFTAGDIREVSDFAKDLGCSVVEVSMPESPNLAVLGRGKDQTAWNRVVKLTALSANPYQRVLYLDADIIAMNDVVNILSDHPEVIEERSLVFSLLNRPTVIDVFEYRWLYFERPERLLPEDIASLITKTFGEALSVEELLALKCWNGGVLLGNGSAVRLLGRTWLSLYTRMLSATKQHEFTAKDQLCFWLAVKKLSGEVEVRELALRWNFMPGHVYGEERVRAGRVGAPEDWGASVIHLAQNKSDPWVAEFLAREGLIGGASIL